MPGVEKGAGEEDPRRFAIVCDDVEFHRLFQLQSALQPISGWCHFSFHLTLHSLTPERSYFAHGGGKFMTTDQMSLLDPVNAGYLDISVEDYQ